MMSSRFPHCEFVNSWGHLCGECLFPSCWLPDFLQDFLRPESKGAGASVVWVYGLGAVSQAVAIMAYRAFRKECVWYSGHAK
jgi:hypothetical protein